MPQSLRGASYMLERRMRQLSSHATSGSMPNGHPQASGSRLLSRDKKIGIACQPGHDNKLRAPSASTTTDAAQSPTSGRATSVALGAVIIVCGRSSFPTERHGGYKGALPRPPLGHRNRVPFAVMQ